MGRGIDGLDTVIHTQNMVDKKWGGTQGGKRWTGSQGGWVGVPIHNSVIQTVDKRYYDDGSIYIQI